MPIYSFPQGAVQVWENKPGQSVNRAAILNAYHSNSLTPNDRDIAEFVFLHGYATAEQLQRFFAGDIPPAQFKRRIQSMLKYRVLNRFQLVPPDNSEPSFFIYCLDMGGFHLLSNFSNQLDNLTNWTPAENMKSSELIARFLVATEFHVLITEACPGVPLRFETNKERFFDRKKFTPTFEFILHDKVVLGEVIRGEEQLELLDDRILRYDILLETQHYKKFWDTKPVLFLIGENDLKALQIAEKVERRSRIKGYRLTTDERMSRGLGARGAFLKYEGNVLREITAKMFQAGDVSYVGVGSAS